MKNLKLIIALLLFGFIITNAQSDETKEKLKNLEGDVTKITIETTDGEVEITGEDADVLFKRMKTEKNIIIKKMHHGDLDKHGNVFFFKEGDHHGAKEIKLDIEIDDKDGENVVVIKKIVCGKETIEEYKGEEAEKFLENHSKGAKKMIIISEDDDITTITMDLDDLHWISKGTQKEIMKKVNVEVEDGIKIVTVTTTEDGKEKVEVYKGDEADKYLEKMEHRKKMRIHISEDGNKKVMKKKVIIIEEKDDDKD